MSRNRLPATSSTSRSIADVAALLVVAAGCGSGAPHEVSPPSAETAVSAPGSGASSSAPSAGPEGAPAGPAEGMVRVPAGDFLRGSPPGVGLDDEHPQRKLWLDAFDIDRTEVTVEAYARCVAAKACEAPRCTKPDHEPEARPDHPVVCVRWLDAEAFCAFAGKRLPSEAEWEKAARGERGQRYPWGDEAPSCERARYAACGEGTVPVGSLVAGKSPYGALDMGGNVWEWTADWHHSDYYAIGPERNPPGPFEGTKKVVRGGAHSYSEKLVDAAGRTYDKPERAFDHVGFRCARSVD